MNKKANRVKQINAPKSASPIWPDFGLARFAKVKCDLALQCAQGGPRRSAVLENDPGPHHGPPIQRSTPPPMCADHRHRGPSGHREKGQGMPGALACFFCGMRHLSPPPQFAPSNFRFAHRRSRLLTGGMGEAQEAACRKADEAQKPVGHLHRDER